MPVTVSPDPIETLRAQSVTLPPPLADHLGPVLEALGPRIEQALRPYHVHLSPQPGGVGVKGDDTAVTLTVRMFEAIGEVQRSTGRLDLAAMLDAVADVVPNALKHDLAYRLTGINHPLRPMSLSQVAFMNAMLHADRSLIFGVGPTGTGKTHLAVAAGLSLLAEGRFKHLVITRPHVLMEGEVMTPALRAETGPDDQLTAVEDALHELIGHEALKRLMDSGQIEITPLGRMRGRTFNDSFIIVDEAQNMTVRKMRMVVTRIGRNARMVITGDHAQVDLPGDEPSGLAHLLGLVEGTDLALVHTFDRRQIIRNDLVARLETLYAGEETPGLRAAA
ncbi:MAG: PhoH family protein [Caulobacter sp.]|nr:PhoH family protein [Caulobacter sp.]